MKKLIFSSLALGTLAGAIAGTTVSCPIAAHATEPMRLAETEMDGITAGAALGLSQNASLAVASGSIDLTTTQREHGSTLPLGGDVITGVGHVVGTASGSSTTGNVTVSADASGNLIAVPVAVAVGTNTPALTVVIGVNAGIAIDGPRVGVPM